MPSTLWYMDVFRLSIISSNVQFMILVIHLCSKRYLPFSSCDTRQVATVMLSW